MSERHYPTSHAEMNLFLSYGTWFGAFGVVSALSLIAAYVYEKPWFLVVTFVGVIVVGASAVMTRRLKVRIISETEFEDANG